MRVGDIRPIKTNSRLFVVLNNAYFDQILFYRGKH